MFILGVESEEKLGTDFRLAIVLLGPPMCGKGTQAKKIVSGRPQSLHICSGDILRMNPDTKDLIADGILAPDDAVIHLVDKTILDQEKEPEIIVFDGFPRSIIQANWFLGRMTGAGYRVAVLSFNNIGIEELLERLPKRKEEEGRRDDSEEILRKRFKDFERYGPELENFFRQRILSMLWSVYRIDSQKKVEDLEKEIRQIVEKEIGEMKLALA